MFTAKSGESKESATEGWTEGKRGRWGVGGVGGSKREDLGEGGGGREGEVYIHRQPDR